MNIKTTVTFIYKLDDSEVEQFKKRTLEYIQEELDYETTITLDDIPTSKVEEFLDDEITKAIEETKQGYGGYGWGIVFDDYFGTISLDYCEEGVSEMVQEFAEQIYKNKEEL